MKKLNLIKSYINKIYYIIHFIIFRISNFISSITISTFYYLNYIYYYSRLVLIDKLYLFYNFFIKKIF